MGSFEIVDMVHSGESGCRNDNEFVVWIEIKLVENIGNFLRIVVLGKLMPAIVVQYRDKRYIAFIVRAAV